MLTDDTALLTALAVGAAALGLPVLFQAARFALVTAFRLRLRRRMHAANAEVEAVYHRTAAIASRADAQQAVLNRLLAEQKQISRCVETVENSRVEMVHEVGAPADKAVLFTCELHRLPDLPSTDFGRTGGPRFVFARAIWDRRNVASIWAETPDAAMDAVRRAFDARTGVVPTRLRRAEVPS